MQESRSRGNCWAFLATRSWAGVMVVVVVMGGVLCVCVCLSVFCPGSSKQLLEGSVPVNPNGTHSWTSQTPSPPVFLRSFWGPQVLL